MTSNGLLQVVRELAEASRALVNGDPEPFKSPLVPCGRCHDLRWLRHTRAGWERVSSRLDWASARFPRRRDQL